MNRVSIAAAFAVALIESTYAIKAAEEDNLDVFGSTFLNFDDEGDLEGEEEEGSGTLYYCPKEDVIYEVLTPEELAAEEAAAACAANDAAAATEATTQDTISGDASTLTASELVNLGIL